MNASGTSVDGDGIHLTVAHKKEWSYGFKPDNQTVLPPCYLESPYDYQRESRTTLTQPARCDLSVGCSLGVFPENWICQPNHPMNRP